MESIFFTQERLGKDGVPITVYKIRSMRGSPVSGDPDLTEQRMAGNYPESDRVTAMGSVLRYLGLDEIPQIYNFLMGEMALVGIRPLPKDDFDLLPDDIKTFYLSQLPGLFPGNLAVARSNGTLEGTYASMRLFMEEVRKLESNPILKNQLLFALRIIFGSLYNRYTDARHIGLIRQRFLIDTLRAIGFAK